MNECPDLNGRMACPGLQQYSSFILQAEHSRPVILLRQIRHPPSTSRASFFCRIRHGSSTVARHSSQMTRIWSYTDIAKVLNPLNWLSYGRDAFSIPARKGMYFHLTVAISSALFEQHQSASFVIIHSRYRSSRHPSLHAAPLKQQIPHFSWRLHCVGNNAKLWRHIRLRKIDHTD